MGLSAAERLEISVASSLPGDGCDDPMNRREIPQV